MALQDLIPKQDDSQIPQMAMPPLAQMPDSSAFPSLRPLVTNPRQQEEQNLQSKINAYEMPNPSKPGFWHALGRVAAKAGNIAGDIIDPATTMLIPGSDLNKRLQYSRDTSHLAGLQNQDLTEQNSASARNYQGAEAAHLAAETPEIGPNAESTRALQDVQRREGEANLSNGPNLLIGHAHAVNSAIAAGQDPAKDPIVLQYEAALRAEKAQPAQKGIDHVPLQDASGHPYEGNFDPNTGKYTDANGNPIANPIPYERPIAITNTTQKQNAPILKEYQPSLDSAERFNVMTKNYEDAVKNHDQQAMLSLLANHLGMTMGLQKGARITRDLYQEAAASTPWLQKVGAKFDKDGYLSGVTLNQQQMKQMVDLGRERFAEDTTKARSAARYLGATDDGPDRIPSKSTINNYLAMSNGDLAKAQELAKQDGWTVK